MNWLFPSLFLFPFLLKWGCTLVAVPEDVTNRVAAELYSLAPALVGVIALAYWRGGPCVRWRARKRLETRIWDPATNSCPVFVAIEHIEEECVKK